MAGMWTLRSLVEGTRNHFRNVGGLEWEYPWMDMGVTEREGMSEEIQRPLWHANSEASIHISIC